MKFTPEEFALLFNRTWIDVGKNGDYESLKKILIDIEETIKNQRS